MLQSGCRELSRLGSQRWSLPLPPISRYRPRLSIITKSVGRVVPTVAAPTMGGVEVVSAPIGGRRHINPRSVSRAGRCPMFR